jgi:hypothetical protein
MSGLTLGHVMIGFATLDLILTWAIGLKLGRAQAELPPERRNPLPYLVFGLGVASAAIICFLAFTLPAAQQPL